MCLEPTTTTTESDSSVGAAKVAVTETAAADAAFTYPTGLPGPAATWTSVAAAGATVSSVNGAPWVWSDGFPALSTTQAETSTGPSGSPLASTSTTPPAAGAESCTVLPPAESATLIRSSGCGSATRTATGTA